jgi:hypothetical protein
MKILENQTRLAAKDNRTGEYEKGIKDEIAVLG